MKYSSIVYYAQDHEIQVEQGFPCCIEELELFFLILVDCLHWQVIALSRKYSRITFFQFIPHKPHDY